MLISIAALRIVALAMPKRDPRKVLMGVHIQRDGASFQMEATTGKVATRLFYTEHDCENSEFVEAAKTTLTNTIISSETVKTLLKMDEFGEWARFDAEGGYIVDPTDLNRIMAINVEGKFPDTNPHYNLAEAASEHDYLLHLPASVLEFLAKQSKKQPATARSHHEMYCTFHLRAKDGKLVNGGVGYCFDGIDRDEIDGVVMPITPFTFVKQDAQDES